MNKDKTVVFKEIKEENLCPLCGTRLFYTMMPLRSDFDDIRNYAYWPRNWHCPQCDKYFERG